MSLTNNHQVLPVSVSIVAFYSYVQRRKINGLICHVSPNFWWIVYYTIISTWLHSLYALNIEVDALSIIQKRLKLYREI